MSIVAAGIVAAGWVAAMSSASGVSAAEHVQDHRHAEDEREQHRQAQQFAEHQQLAVATPFGIFQTISQAGEFRVIAARRTLSDQRRCDHTRAFVLRG
ncbi:MAG: hypothetical protein QM754_02415 [Tepidisphaeraceae bacterium]